MVENCKTEIRKGTAYQSWDWNKVNKQGAEFENLELKQGGPWNTGLQGGDSKWQQEVWNCQTKVENFAEFEIWKIEDLNRFNLKTFIFDSVILSESWYLKRILSLQDFIKIYENLGIKLNTSFEESLKLDENLNLKIKSYYLDSFLVRESFKFLFSIAFQDACLLGEILYLNLAQSFFDSSLLEETLKLDGKTFQSDLISLTDSLKYIIINYSFNEGFFELDESLRFNSSIHFDDSVKLSDVLLVKVFPGYGASGYGTVGYGG